MPQPRPTRNWTIPAATARFAAAAPLLAPYPDSVGWVIAGLGCAKAWQADSQAFYAARIGINHLKFCAAFMGNNFAPHWHTAHADKD